MLRPKLSRHALRCNACHCKYHSSKSVGVVTAGALSRGCKAVRTQRHGHQQDPYEGGGANRNSFFLFFKPLRGRGKPNTNGDYVQFSEKDILPKQTAPEVGGGGLNLSSTKDLLLCQTLDGSSASEGCDVSHPPIHTQTQGVCSAHPQHH